MTKSYNHDIHKSKKMYENEYELIWCQTRIFISKACTSLRHFPNFQNNYTTCIVHTY